MRILHTSDWHIGKRLMGRDRLGEQAAALDEIVSICDGEGVELVLVAGDIFDTYLPSAEAEELFFSGIRKMAGRDPGRAAHQRQSRRRRAPLRRGAPLRGDGHLYRRQREKAAAAVLHPSRPSRIFRLRLDGI